MGRSKRSKNRNREKSKSKNRELKDRFEESLKLRKKVNRKMEKNNILVGIYDSFRKGGKYNLTFDSANATLIGSYSSEPIYNLIDLGIEDVVLTKDGETSVKIEVWELSESVLSKLESDYNYYDCIPNSDNTYLKTKVKSPYGEITLYLYNDDTIGGSLIKNGDAIEHLDLIKILGRKTIDTTFAKVDKEFMD